MQGESCCFALKVLDDARDDDRAEEKWMHFQNIHRSFSGGKKRMFFFWLYWCDSTQLENCGVGLEALAGAEAGHVSPSTVSLGLVLEASGVNSAPTEIHENP